MANLFFFLSYLLILAATQPTDAVTYVVNNTAATTPGGARFTTEIGDEYSRQTLESAINFIWSIFRPSSPAERKSPRRQQVTLFVDDMDGVAYAVSNEIHLSARYIGGYSGDVKREVTGVLYHEMTHTWQWNGKGQTPGGLVEGIADFVRLKGGYAPSHWVKPGQGERWDQGYDDTAQFLAYCGGLRSEFVAELDKKMKSGYGANCFVELLGKTVDQLWSDYKAKYKN